MALSLGFCCVRTAASDDNDNEYFIDCNKFPSKLVRWYKRGLG